MHLRLATAVASLSLFGAASSNAAPEVLIIQRNSHREGDYNVSVGQLLAEELDVEGRVAAILWSMLDPVFRAYVDDGKLPGFVDNPDDRTIQSYAAKLDVAYVLVVEAVARGGQVVPQAVLYGRNRTRPIWSMVREESRGKPRLVVIDGGKVDEEKTRQIREKYADLLEDGTLRTMSVLVNGEPDWQSTASTLARTWSRILAEGPFRELEPQRRTFTPDPDPGLTFAVGETSDGVLKTEQALERARLLASDGHVDEAILLMRDAVDADPFSAPCRVRLVGLLVERGETVIAAVEAERGAALSDQPGALWALAADSWAISGEPDKALNAANEARARGVDSPEVLLTLGDVWLLKGDSARAVQFYDDAIKQSPTPRAHLGRSLARSMDGDVQGGIKDLEEAQGSSQIPAGLYQRAMMILDRELETVAQLLRTVPQRVRMQNGPDMTPSAESLHRRASALVEFLVRIRAPERHKGSHDLRDLAHKLLAQSSVEVLDYARTKNEDAALEAAISLGEALKMVPRIRETFRLERKYGEKALAG